MEVVYGCVAGLDVHKQTVVACVRRLQPNGQGWKEVRTFATMMRNLHALAAWLAAEAVTHVAMEATGSWWKPVYNVLEGRFPAVWLVNARHIKQVPGRKTDVQDSEWLAQLLQCGLVRPSFVPRREQRELRELTRQRLKLVQQHTQVVNRLHAVLQDANVKLSSVATDILGASGRDMLAALQRGEEDPMELAELARGRLRAKLPALRVALEGQVRAHHRFMLGLLLDQLDFLARTIDRVSQRLAAISPEDFHAAVRRLMTIDGIKQRTAEAVIAETGTDMRQFPSAARLSAWAGLCPGNNESAGKRQTGRTPKGNRWLRAALGEAAWAAARTKQTFLAARFHRLAARRGRKRAVVALAHTLLIGAYHLMSTDRDYRDLGPDHFERLDPQRHVRYHVAKLEALGHKVTLEPVQRAA